jgi:hypothetical protein
LAVDDYSLAACRADVYTQEIPAQRPFPFNVIASEAKQSTCRALLIVLRLPRRLRLLAMTCKTITVISP